MTNRPTNRRTDGRTDGQTDGHTLLLSHFVATKNQSHTYFLGSEFKSHTRRFLARHKIRQYSTNVGLFPKVIARMYFHLKIPFSHVTLLSKFSMTPWLPPPFLPCPFYTPFFTSDRLVWLRLASKISREYSFNAWSTSGRCDILHWFRWRIIYTIIALTLEFTGVCHLWRWHEEHSLLTNVS